MYIVYKICKYCFLLLVKIKMKAEEKTLTPRVRIAVIGNANVGKSGKLFKRAIIYSVSIS